MSTITKLQFSTGIDLGGWSRDIQSGSAMVERWASDAQRSLDSIKAPTADFAPKIDSQAVTDQAGALAAAVAPLGATIKNAINQAAGPVRAFATTFAAQFEEVGATVELLSIRIDNAMRAPMLKARADRIRRTIEGAFLIPSRNVPKAVAEAVDASVGREADASKLVASFARIPEQVKVALAPLPNVVGYAIEKAAHVPAGGLESLLKGFEGETSQAIERMKAMAEEAQGRARGKGSLTKRRKGKSQAEQISSAHESIGPTILQTDAGPMIRDYKSLQQELKAVADWWARIRGSVEGSIAPTTELGKGFDRVRAASAKIYEGLAAGPRIIGANLSRAFDLSQLPGKARGVFQNIGSVANATFSKLKIPTLIDPRQSQLLKGIGGAAQGAAGSVKGLGVAALAAGGIFSASFTAVDFFSKGIQGASSLNETLSKTDAVLGESSAGVKSYADDLASAFGLVKGETLDVASGFGSQFKAIGQSGKDLEDTVKQFTTLSADISSFGNVSFEEAGKSLRSALSGNESDLLKQLGVNTQEATLKTIAYANGIAKTGTELNEQQKVQARMIAIWEGTKDVQGDLGRTSDSTANQFRKFTGTIDNLASSVGTALLPSVNAALGMFNDLAGWATSGFDGAKGAFSDFFGGVEYGFNVVSSAIRMPQASFEVLRLSAVQALTNIGEIADTLPANFEIVTSYIGRNWQALCKDLANVWMTYIQNSIANIQILGGAIGEFLADPSKGFKPNFKGFLEGFEATAEKLPELIKPALTDMSAQIGNAMKPIFDDVQRKADEAKKRADAMQKTAGLKADLEAKMSPDKDLANYAKKITEEVKTPFEKYTEELEKLKQAKAANLIDDKTFKRGQIDAFHDNKLDEVHHAGAVELGSKEAYSALLAATTRKSGGPQTLEKINQQQLATQQRGNALAERQARAAERQVDYWKGVITGII